MSVPIRRRRIAVAAAIAVVGVVVAIVAVAPRTAEADWLTDCTSPTVTYSTANPAPANLNLTAADRVLFADGTYTGSVNSSGATICVDVAAQFNPSNMNGASRLFVRGSVLAPPLAVGDGALLDNEGTVRFLPQVNTNGITEVFNRAGATILVDAPGLSLGPGVTVINDGAITVTGFVNMNSPGPTVTNNEQLTITGALNVTGTITNNDQMVVGGLLTVNGGGQLVNACALTAAGGLINDETVTNSGVIDLQSSALNNTGGSVYAQTSTALTSGGNFTNDGTVNGSGQYLFAGTTTNHATVAGVDAADPIIFYDVSPTGDQIFDVQTGTVTNTVRQVVTPPPPGSCTVLPPEPTTTTSTTTTSSTTTTTTEPPTTTTSTTTTTTTEPPTTTTSTTTTSTTTTTTTSTTTSTTTTTSTSTTTTTEPPTTTTTTEPATTTTTDPATTTTAPAPTTTTTTTTPVGPTTTTTSLPAATTTVATGSGSGSGSTAPGGGTLPTTGGATVGHSTVIAVLCTIAGAVLILIARPRRAR